MVKCPNCFTNLEGLGRAAFVCEQEFCGPRLDEAATAYHGSEVRMMRVREVSAAGIVPDSATCEGCGKPTSTQVCPVCHYQLPPAWRMMPTLCVAMAGARATGKSFYIAVMKRQLERLFSEGGRTSFDYATPTTRNLYEERYQRPLYEARQVIKPTPRAAQSPAERAPLIFRIGVATGGMAHLVIRDVAGEDLERGSLADRAFDFFALADAIIFMVDPLKVRSVQQMLMGLVPDTGVGADPMVVLNTLLTKLREPGRAPAHVPIAVVLSKFDVLHELACVQGADWSKIMSNHGAAFLRDPSMLSLAYDDRDGRLLHEEIRSLLQRMDAAALVRQVESASPTARYFATSSLGQHSLGEDLHPRGISPFRCVDPMKWVLARAGMIPIQGVVEPLDAA
jgi:hypothetical protein